MSIFSELKSLNPISPEAFPSASLEVSLIIPARSSAQTLENTVKEATDFLSARYPNQYEIILVPNPAPGDQDDQSITIAQDLAKRYPSIQVCPHSYPPGKGAAIRTGFQSSRGRWIFLTDADLPYRLEFFDQAIQKLRSGYDLVTGNRRLPSSYFQIPVRLLPLAYGRHRLGLGFNRFVRLLLPISTTDTQAGIKALSRRLAISVFSQQSCPGFLYDLEIFLTAHGHRYPQIELPVVLLLNSEKSTVRILRECVLVANWLIKLTWRNSRNMYGKKKSVGPIVSRYQGASLLTRLFLWARWKLTPYDRMAQRLPVQGNILDLGCGHGLFTLAAATHAPTRQVIGIDHDSQRIDLGSRALKDLPNVKLEAGNMMTLKEKYPPFSAIAMIDVMHYFSPDHQEQLLKQAFDLLEEGGTLLVREVNPQAGLISQWNRVYEKLATGIGFTQTDKASHHFRSKEGWEDLLSGIGFQVRSERCSSPLFADILYVCERTPRLN